MMPQRLIYTLHSGQKEFEQARDLKVASVVVLKELINAVKLQRRGRRKFE